MRLLTVICALAFLICAPGFSYAIGLEVAIGGWGESPSGTFGYKPELTSDRIDLERDAKYSDETRMYARAKLEMPLVIPNVYIFATPMKFEGTGNKSGSFTFGDEVFSGSVDFKSKLVLDHYDIALYYGIPFLETATMGKFNVELGLNPRIIEFEAEVEQVGTGINASRSLTFVVPMVYVGARFRPVDIFAVELEARGIAVSGNHYYDFIARLKAKPIGPMFIALGYRTEDILIDEKDVEVKVDFSGLFVEAGVEL